MIDFIIARHGMTEPNTRGVCLGRSDVPLIPQGYEQAMRLAERMKDIKADAVFTSPLLRASDTAKCYMRAARLDIPLTEDPRLEERDWGDWEGVSFADVARDRPEEYAQFYGDIYNFTVPGGECSVNVQARVNELIDYIISEYDGKTVCLFTHLGTARHIISRLLGLAPEESWRFFLDTATYARIEYDTAAGNGLLKGLSN